jgi:hypothetical protein
VSVERLIGVGLLAVTAVFLVRLLVQAVRVLQTYSGTSERRQEDATASAPAPEPDTAERVASLGILGYHQIGTTRVVLPFGVQYGRIMAADDESSYAIVVDAPQGVPVLSAFYSSWPDGNWIGTMYPSGDRHQRPGLQLSVSSGSLGDAVATHRAAIERMRGAHGHPRPIARMADVLALDADYRQRFGGRELRPLVVRSLAPTVALLAVWLVSLYVVLTMP